MSEAFDSFLKQYNATGKERSDGFYPEDFAAMTKQELLIAEEMLIEGANKFDSNAIQGLGMLKTQKAENVLLSLLRRVKPPSMIHLRIVEALWENKQDNVYQKLILDDFSEDDDDLRKQAAIVLEYTTPSQITHDTFIKMLMEEKESIMRMGAARGILIYYGLMKSANDDDGYKKNLQYIRLLKNSYDKYSLAAAVAEVEKEAARIKG